MAFTRWQTRPHRVLLCTLAGWLAGPVVRIRVQLYESKQNFQTSSRAANTWWPPWITMQFPYRTVAVCQRFDGPVPIIVQPTGRNTLDAFPAGDIPGTKRYSQLCHDY